MYNAYVTGARCASRKPHNATIAWPTVSYFSDYIVYVDESGDHGLDGIDPDYPVFVLAFCIFKKAEYVARVVPRFQDFRFEHFGHDAVVFHERSIRKELGAFSGLKSPERKRAFLDALTDVIHECSFNVIATVIDKRIYVRRYSSPGNPYHVALAFGLERVAMFLNRRGQKGRLTHLIFERRGRREDDQIELEFRRVCAGRNRTEARLPFEIIFVDKKANSTGLQLADLIARPIGLSVLRPGQPNRAFEVIEPKFDRSPEGRVDGWGLKCFP